MGTTIDREATQLAHQMAELGRDERSRVFSMSWWSERLLARAMDDAAFRTQLFRFVDVFPATTGSADVLRHVEEYFGADNAPRLLRAGVSVAGVVPGVGPKATAAVARRNIQRMAGQFIVGTTPDEAVATLERLWKEGSAFTVDLLGEKTVVEAEADHYAERVRAMMVALLDAAPAWPPQPRLENDDLGALPRVNVSIKPTALASKYAPLTRDAGLEQATARLRPLLRLARDRGAFVHFDMEHADVKDLTLELFRRLLSEEEFTGMEAGIVIQAYLKDARSDLADLIAWSARRPVPVTVRLVKGAYWDTETVIARASGWASPVFEDKEETDASFERCVRLLHDHHGEVRAAFGSHNLRSLAYSVTYARQCGIPDDGYELQMLVGMAEPLAAAVRRLGLRLRMYAPVGELVPGMAYLVRRLLENTSNESFVRLSFAEGRDLDELVQPPDPGPLPDPAAPVEARDTDLDDPAPHEPEPVAEWRRASVRESFARAVDAAAGSLGIDVPAVIDGERVRTRATIVSVDPSRPEVVVAASASCGASLADDAVAVARGAAGGWRRTPAGQRAAVLFRAASWMRARRNELAALEVFEAGKPWAEADADVAEAIDFCEYYGREVRRLDNGGVVQSPPGEDNVLRYQGKGVAAVIAPWNFPLAIPCGMTVACIAAGNATILKPAEQTPAVAYQLVEALEAAGLPRGVLGFLPGPGEDVGARLVEHPDVDVIAFTGSREVGLAINREAAVPRPGQRSVKRVIAEMGGKNALIVDGDADLDQAVPIVIQSAFGYSGQKCSAGSRLVALDSVADQLLDRVVGAAGQLRIDHPRFMGTEMGPLIEADAVERVRRYTAMGREEGQILLARDDVPGTGFFAGPVIVSDVDPATSALAREEIFGPVLTVLRARDIDHAIELANDTDFALTAGIVSRSPANIKRAAHELRAGNVYINRSTTGAVVGRQPFGGYGLSGVGSKAGGPDYLLQLMDPRVVTENTMRQGFAPLEDGSA